MPMQSNPRTKNVLLSMENLSFIVFRYFWSIVLLLLWLFSVRFTFTECVCMCACVCISFVSRTISKIPLSILINSISSGVFIHSFCLNLKFMVSDGNLFSPKRIAVVKKPPNKQRTSTNSQRCVRKGKNLLRIL